MTPAGIIQIVVYFAILVAVTKPAGLFMTRVFQGERTFLHPILGWLERAIYRLGGIKPDREQRWTQYPDRCWPSVFAVSCSRMFSNALRPICR